MDNPIERIQALAQELNNTVLHEDSVSCNKVIELSQKLDKIMVDYIKSKCIGSLKRSDCVRY